MEKDWYDEWFDTPFYHILYKHRDFEEASRFIDRLADFMAIPAKAKILDLACGKGRHAIKLSQMGFDVTGVDLSQNSIELATRYANNMLHFDVHDMRNIYRYNFFDFVLNLFTSFGYFEKDDDNFLVVDAAAKSLKNNGFVVLDFLNVNKVLKQLKPLEEVEREGIKFQIKKQLKDNFIVKSIGFFAGEKEYFFEERVKAYDLGQLQKFFDAASLKLIHVFGNYELQNFDAQSSERLILIGKKQ